MFYLHRWRGPSSTGVSARRGWLEKLLTGCVVFSVTVLYFDGITIKYKLNRRQLRSVLKLEQPPTNSVAIRSNCAENRPELRCRHLWVEYKSAWRYPEDESEIFTRCPLRWTRTRSIHRRALPKLYFVRYLNTDSAEINAFLHGAKRKLQPRYILSLNKVSAAVTRCHTEKIDTGGA